MIYFIGFTSKTSKRLFYVHKNILLIFFITSQLHVFVITSAPSGPPLDVRSISETPHSLTLAWTSPKPDQVNGQLVAFTIYFRRSDLNYDGDVIEGTREGEEKVKVDGKLREWTLKNLRAYSGYDVTMTASTQIGEGPKSEKVFVSTLETSL